MPTIPRPLVHRFWAKVQKSLTPDGCWTWTGTLMRTGYGRITRDSGEVITAHRASYELANGPIPAGLQVQHKCDNRACVRPDHLDVGSAADNSRDAVNRGRIPHGERHRSAKLTDSDVAKIRQQRAGGVPLKTLAAKYAVTVSTISEIANGNKRKGGAATS